MERVKKEGESVIAEENWHGITLFPLFALNLTLTTRKSVAAKKYQPCSPFNLSRDKGFQENCDKFQINTDKQGLFFFSHSKQEQQRQYFIIHIRFKRISKDFIQTTASSLFFSLLDHALFLSFQCLLPLG